MDFKRLDDVSGVGAERFGGIARGSWGSNALAGCEIRKYKFE